MTFFSTPISPKSLLKTIMNGKAIAIRAVAVRLLRGGARQSDGGRYGNKAPIAILSKTKP